MTARRCGRSRGLRNVSCRGRAPERDVDFRVGVAASGVYGEDSAPAVAGAFGDEALPPVAGGRQRPNYAPSIRRRRGLGDVLRLTAIRRLVDPGRWARSQRDVSGRRAFGAHQVACLDRVPIGAGWRRRTRASRGSRLTVSALRPDRQPGEVPASTDVRWPRPRKVARQPAAPVSQFGQKRIMSPSSGSNPTSERRGRRP